MLKDHPVIQETTHVSNAVNKDTSPATAHKGNAVTITMPISSILTTMTKSTTTITPRSSQSTLSTISKLDLLTFQVMTKPNWRKKWA